MQRKRYETNMDLVQAQATARARASLHPDAVAAAERGPQPIERQTGGVEAPPERAPAQNGLGSILDRQRLSQRLMQHRIPQQEPNPNMRDTLLEELRRRHSGAAA